MARLNGIRQVIFLVGVEFELPPEEMAAPKYTLTYFNARGIAEPIRYLFAYGNIEFEDLRVEEAQWPELKSKQPFGKLPVLQFDDSTLSESQAIARYVAKEIGLAGKSPIESALCDMLTDALKDCCAGRSLFMHEPDEAKKTELKDKFFKDTVPPCLAKLEEYLKKNWIYFVGDELTWADLVIAYALLELKTFEHTVLDKYPALQEHATLIHDIPAIKSWVEKRPKTAY